MKLGLTHASQWIIVQCAVISVLITVNLLISYFVRTQELLLDLNTNPFLYLAHHPIVFIMLVILTIGFIYLKLLQKFPVYTLLIMSGMWSNFLEFSVYGDVADYLPLINGSFNIADVEIWVGLVFLTYMVWFAEPQDRKHFQEAHSS